MKAITIWQPWASLLVSGQKIYETRSWATTYRGPIAIHAAKRPVRQTIDALAKGNLLETLALFESLFHGPKELTQLSTGAIVGKALLVRCNPIDEAFVAKLTPQERTLGDFSLGRYAWEFQKMIPVDPSVPAKGMQGLWDWNGSP